jgi:chemotaxis protein MotB
MARNRRQEDPPKGSPAWMNTFSDLMNLLLCFFVMLFALSDVNQEKYTEVVASMSNTFGIFESGGPLIGEGQLITGGVGQVADLAEYATEVDKLEEETDQKETDPLKYLEEQRKELSQEMYDEMTELAEEYKIDNQIDINIDSQYHFIKISIGGSILFDSGIADIKTDALPILKKVGGILKYYDDYLIKIEGHTDNVPITSNNKYNDNIELSTARAISVWKYLTQEVGLDESTLEASGRSEFDPIASNDTPNGRAKNRRVEIKIYNELSN